MSASGPNCEIVIRNGLVYDGTGTPPIHGDVAVDQGKVLAVGANLPHKGTREVDATGKWVSPGFFDIHTHYDAELEALPGLEESVRHGVTNIIMGNCSLSTALGTEEDLLNIFCRVESLPRELLSKWLGGKVTWKSVADYYKHLETEVPIGPNVGSFLGHSNVRIKVMGLERSLNEPKATENELHQMEKIVEEAMNAGFLGFSIDMLPWHRMDGEPYKGISVPSQQAASSEHRRLADVVRRYGRVLQATPNALMKTTVLQILGMSIGLFRKPLRTTIVAAMDVKTDRKVYRLATGMARVVNEILGGNVRWQALAEPFLNFCDGVNTPLFEEFPAGVKAISASPHMRHELFRDEKFRKEFRSQWEERGQRVFHRNLDDMWIVSAPDASLVGKSFAQVARERNREPIVCFMDLLAEHDNALRWKTIVTNDRPAQRRYIFTHKYTLPGFNDSGAHNRNMAFQDGALQMLQQVLLNPDVMPVEKAVRKLTKETAEWLGVDAGSLTAGSHADLVVIDPERLRGGLSEPIEFKDERLDGSMRMVKRSEGVVRQVIIGGRIAFDDGRFVPEFGKQRFGRLLKGLRNEA